MYTVYVYSICIRCIYGICIQYMYSVYIWYMYTVYILVEVLPQTTSPDVGMSSRWQWCGPSERASACVDGWREDARALTNVRLPLVVLKVGRPAGFSTTAMKSSSYSTSRYSGFPLKSIGDLGIVKKIEEFEAFVPGRDPLFE